MAIIHEGDEYDTYFITNGWPCFYCHKPLTFPSVQWRGANIDPAVMHPKCVLELTIRLFRDLHEIELQSPRYLTDRDGE